MARTISFSQDGADFYAEEAFGPFARGECVWSAAFKVLDWDTDAAVLARRHFIAQLTALAPYIEPRFPTIAEQTEAAQCPA
jgi:hypothetical protein